MFVVRVFVARVFAVRVFAVIVFVVRVFVVRVFASAGWSVRYVLYGYTDSLDSWLLVLFLLRTVHT